MIKFPHCDVCNSPANEPNNAPIVLVIKSNGDAKNTAIFIMVEVRKSFMAYTCPIDKRTPCPNLHQSTTISVWLLKSSISKSLFSNVESSDTNAVVLSGLMEKKVQVAIVQNGSAK